MKNTAFAQKQFKHLIIPGTIATMVTCVGNFLSNIIAGNMLGEQALTATTICMPVITFIMFLALLFSYGGSVAFLSEVGKGDIYKANKFFSQSLILAVCSGIIFIIVGFLFFNQIVDLLGTAPSLKAHVESYLTLILFFSLITIISNAFSSFIYNEGNSKTVMLASLVAIVTNIVFCFGLISFTKLGIAAVAIATAIGEFVRISILSSHFFNKKCALRFVKCFDKEDGLKILQLGSSESSAFVLTSITVVILNNFMISNFHTQGALLYSIILNLSIILMSLFDGIGMAMFPLATYFGEKNYKGMKNIFDMSLIITLIDCIVVTSLLLTFPSFFCKLFGITTPFTHETMTAFRWFALSVIFTGLTSLFVTYLQYVQQTVFAFVSTFMINLGLQVPIVMGLGMVFGVDGAGAGFLLSDLIILLVIIYLLKKQSILINGENASLLPLDKTYSDNLFIINCKTSKESVMEALPLVEEELKRRGVEQFKILKIVLTLEEHGMSVVERCKSDDYLMEFVLDFNEGLKISAKDDFDVYNPSDMDAKINSKYSYTRLTILANIANKTNYIFAVGNNKVEYSFS